MKALVIYDSYFGNTEKVARAIADELAGGYDVEVLRVGEATKERLAGVQVLVVGSPTRAFRATPAIRKFVKRIPRGSLRGVVVAAFDTRIAVCEVDSRILSLLVKWFGYAAEPTGTVLANRGGTSPVEPAGFIVEDSEGPLRDGELERAAAWARSIVDPA